MDEARQGGSATSGGVMVVAAALLAIGLVMVGSATASLDRPLLGEAIWTSAFGRQLLFILIGVGIMLATSKAAATVMGSTGARARLPAILFSVSIGFLILALVPGVADPHRGSYRWLPMDAIGLDISFQPSELAKLALVVFLASLLGGPAKDPRLFFRSFVPASLSVGLCVVLVGKENFGTAALIATVAFAILVVAGCRLHHLLLIAGTGVSGLTTILFAAEYRIKRLAAFENFWNDPLGAGYQPLQSLATIASGEWFGRGLGNGIQKYGYLPESHTDFVFAVICEELGVFGAGVVLLLFAAFAWLGMRIMLSAPTRMERLLAFGLTLMVTLQAVMNVAVVTVLTPTTGVPLPMVSAGGSGVFVMAAMVGLLAAIGRRGGLPDEFSEAAMTAERPVV